MTNLPSICTQPDCDRPAKVKGLCQRCYSRLYQRERSKKRQERAAFTQHMAPKATCKMWKCKEPEFMNFLCRKHAEEVYVHLDEK